MAGIAVVEIVAAVAVVLAALGGVAEASFPAYFSAAKTRLASVDNYIVRSEGALVFVVEVAIEVASEFVTEVEIGLEPGPEHEPGEIVTAEVVAVVSGAEAEAFG